jgi:peroxiredoxin
MNTPYQKYIYFIAFFIASAISTPLTAKTVKILVQASQCDDIEEMHLFKFDGLGFVKEQSTAKNKDGEFVFEVKTKNRLFRYVGVEVGKFKSVVLGDDDTVIMKGSCKSFNKATTPEGLNYAYNDMMNKIRSFSGKEKSIATRFARSYKDPVKKEAIILEYAALDQNKRELIEASQAKSKWLGEVAGLYTYYSFQNSGSELPNELAYYVNNYFANADLKSEAFSDMPLLFDVFNKFTSTLTKVRGINEAMLEKYVDFNLDKMSAKSLSRKMALGGVLSALRSGQSPLFIAYANEYLETYGGKSESAQKLLAQIKNAKSFVIGGEAPDFTMLNMEDKEVNLSDFKGKVVLIDFWASWCGPCRKENPHVVKLYEKYKEDGFEILGVSLDKTKDRWLQAVEKDGLTWPQVSDLKGWQNEVAQMYSVKSIPHTVLLDKEGKILAFKLRGPQLDQALKEIFGH